MMTPEREKEIRKVAGYPDVVYELLVELDRVRREMGDAKENAALAIMANEQLHTKLEQMTSSIYHTPLTIFGEKSGGDLIAENTQLRSTVDNQKHLLRDRDTQCRKLRAKLDLAVNALENILNTDILNEPLDDIYELSTQALAKIRGRNEY